MRRRAKGKICPREPTEMQDMGIGSIPIPYPCVLGGVLEILSHFGSAG